MGVEDLLQKHMLLEADINVVGERVKSVNNNAQRFVDGEFPEAGGGCIMIDLKIALWRQHCRSFDGIMIVHFFYYIVMAALYDKVHLIAIIL